jgi:oligoendopeptidase F
MTTPEMLRTATWDEVARLYQPLLDEPLESSNRDQVEQWLDAWGVLDSALIEASTRVLYEVSGDSNDPVKEATHLTFAADIMPRHSEIVTTLASKLLDSGYTRPDLETTLQRFRTRRDLFRRENIPLHQALAELSNQYNSVCGGMIVEWQGKSVPVSRLNPWLEHPDRDIREQAWRLSFQPYLEHREELADIFDRQLVLRQEIARNAGFRNYLDYTFADLHRYDYSPDDCRTFHQSVRKTFVPAATAIMEERRRTLGIASLRPWDLSVDTEARAALAPYSSIDKLVEKTGHVFTKLDPVFGEQFAGLQARQLLDLDSRPGKRPGGFCSPLPWQEQACIFMNASGTPTDVATLMHEAGHAFHEIAMADLPFVYQRQIGEEMCEVASMSMELITWPWLGADEGGFYEKQDLSRAKAQHFEQILTRFPWISVVDAFQHWLYTDPAAADRDARDRKFVEIWSQYDQHTDWAELDDLRAIRWYRQLHIFLHPLYYIEYGIAQLGALQVWKHTQSDQSGALANLRAAFALGGTQSLPELYATAGARMIFDEAGMGELVQMIEGELASPGGCLRRWSPLMR